MFFQSCFLSDFIIDRLFLFRGLFFIPPVLFFLFLLFLVVLGWGFIVLFKGFCLLILFKFFYCF
ncbi:hypothetical protein HMPREF1420_00714 [Helicobacter pylori GAM264Ai]|nr:hypothetical protein HMPREF1420_00714 [Helicobacter pylori GAM264Ai]